jgi:hypothetical protein
MGNNFSKDSSDKRFGNHLLGKEVHKIMTNQETVYLGKTIKLNVAKACCREVVRRGISDDKTNVVSIPFPQPLALDNPKCQNEGICLDTVYVGYQIDDDTDKFCRRGGVIGNIDISINKNEKEKGNSSCDNFMIDYCAKSLYEQGCLKIKPNQQGKIKPQFAGKKENKLCWNDSGRMSYGPPECECLNSIYGVNLNTWPSRNELDPFYDDTNPYGLNGLQLDNLGNTKYSLNIFDTRSVEQYPVQRDTRCATASTSGNSNRSKAYLLSKDKQPNQMTFCINSIVINESTVGKLSLEDIKQTNNCGGGASPGINESPSIDPNKKLSPEEVAKADAEVKAKADADAKAKADADNRMKTELEAKRKADADAKKQKDEVDSLKRLVDDIKIKADADKAKADADKAKADADKAKADADAKAKTDADAKAKAEADAKAKADAENNILKTISKIVGFEVTLLHIGGVILILIILYLLLSGGGKKKIIKYKKYKKKSSDD